VRRWPFERFAALFRDYPDTLTGDGLVPYWIAAKRLGIGERQLHRILPRPWLSENCPCTTRDLVRRFGRLCARDSCRRPFLTADRRKLYCSRPCAKHVSASEAVQRRRSLEATAKLRRLRNALQALAAVKVEPSRRKRWLAKRAGLTLNWVTRHEQEALAQPNRVQARGAQRKTIRWR
jgi:hypothetical protein